MPPKATCTSFSSCFLGKQTGSRHQPGNFAAFRWRNGERRRKDPVSPQKGGQATRVGKAAGKFQCAFREASLFAVPGSPSKIHGLQKHSSPMDRVPWCAEQTHRGSRAGVTSGEGQLPRRCVVARGVRGEPLGKTHRVQLHLSKVEVLKELKERRKTI